MLRPAQHQYTKFEENSCFISLVDYFNDIMYIVFNQVTSTFDPLEFGPMFTGFCGEPKPTHKPSLRKIHGIFLKLV